MSRPEFVYVTYIASTPEKVWQALTDARTSAQYWFGYSLHSGWTVGSGVTLKAPGAGKVMDKGVILESDRPRRLSYSWFPQYEEFKHERPSRVTFELKPFKGQVQLTLVHDDFDEGSKVFESISGGWPKVLSSLKSWLETGKALEPSWSAEDMKRVEEGARA
jgi:uncharacterized protein YndB with AHSA1/START domain